MSRVHGVALLVALVGAACESDAESGDSEDSGDPWTCWAYFGGVCVCDEVRTVVHPDEAEQVSACVGYEACFGYLDTGIGSRGCNCGSANVNPGSGRMVTDVRPVTSCPPTD